MDQGCVPPGNRRMIQADDSTHGAIATDEVVWLAIDGYCVSGAIGAKRCWPRGRTCPLQRTARAANK